MIQGPDLSAAWLRGDDTEDGYFAATTEDPDVEAAIDAKASQVTACSEDGQSYWGLSSPRQPLSIALGYVGWSRCNSNGLLYTIALP